ncbi:MAG: extracellular solute-binding protein, partial [Clostridiales bacterium]|nr:extracellular solute-binding protein [Clostridiales bacterium]
MKKSLAVIFGIFLLYVLISGCSNQNMISNKEKKEINVYNWGEYIDIDLLDQFYKETGIKVNYSTFVSNEDLYTKLKFEDITYDVIIPSDYMIDRMIHEGMLEKLDFKNIPNFSFIRDDLKKPEYDKTGEYSVPYAWGVVGIIYNKIKVTDPVDSWNI